MLKICLWGGSHNVRDVTVTCHSNLLRLAADDMLRLCSAAVKQAASSTIQCADRFSQPPSNNSSHLSGKMHEHCLVYQQRGSTTKSNTATSGPQQQLAVVQLCNVIHLASKSSRQQL